MSQGEATNALESGTPELVTKWPEGVTPFIGIPNKLLVVAYIGWLIAINLLVTKSKKRS